jgi:hypothetical protein
MPGGFAAGEAGADNVNGVVPRVRHGSV